MSEPEKKDSAVPEDSSKKETAPDSPAGKADKKPAAGALSAKDKRTFVRRRQRPRIRWDARDAAEIQRSTQELMKREEPGARIRLGIGIGALCLLVVTVVLVFAFPPKSRLPPIQTLHNEFRRAGLPYKTTQIHVDGPEKTTLHIVTVADLSPLKGIPLKALYVRNTNAVDLAPLRGMPMECLLLNDTRVADLSSVTGMPLRFLDIRGTAVTNLAPLQGMALKYIGLSADRATNGIDVLREMKSLQLINKMPTNEFWIRYDRGDFRPPPAEGDGATAPAAAPPAPAPASSPPSTNTAPAEPALP